MIWLSTCNVSDELKAVSSDTRPWALLKKFWQFSCTYGEYHSLPPCERRQFIIDREEQQEAIS